MGQACARPDGTEALKGAQSLAGAAARREPFPSAAPFFAKVRGPRMKKSAIPVTGAGAALLLIAIGLSGCPIYDDDDYGCSDDLECASGYSCDVDSGRCYAEAEGKACRRPLDCGTNETCSRSATCKVGDCHFDSVGCVQGYECQSVDGQWMCVDEDNVGQGGAPATSAGAPATNGGAPGESGGAPAGGSSG